MKIFNIARHMFFAAMCVVFGARAQDSTENFVQGPAKGSILWRVDGNGLSHSSYVLGILKFMGDKEYVLPDTVKKCLLMCTTFAIEDQIDHHAQHELNKVIHLPKGKSLLNLLSLEDYVRLQTIFKEQFKIGKCKMKRKYDRLTPLALSIVMTRLALHEGVKFYDIELLKIAKWNKLKTYSLESVEREAEALGSFSLQKQTEVLRNLIAEDNLELQKKEFLAMEDTYAKGDLDKALEHSLHLFERDSAFMEEFYFKRTEEWLPKIEKMFAAEKSFAAIGILHLKGERGLLTLLKNKGYTLTPIPVN